MTALRTQPSVRVRRERGFTLIEMLAVVLLLAIVFVFAIDFYLDLSRASNRAAEDMRSLRRAVAVLDRLARDLGETVLVRKPPETDPLEHPWLFLAEARASDAGADRLKFVTRGHRPRSDQAVESDLEVVAWMLRESEVEGLELARWSSPRLPEGLDRSFPRADDAGVLLVADGIASFGVRFLSEEGEWQSDWDSSMLIESGELPVAAEISLSFLAPGAADAWEADGEQAPFLRRVLLPLRPLDLEALLHGEIAEGEATGEEDEEDEEGGVTVAECCDRHPDLCAQLPPEAQQVVQSLSSQPAAVLKDMAQQAGIAIPGDCL